MGKQATCAEDISESVREFLNFLERDTSMNQFSISADAPRLKKLIERLFDRWHLSDHERRAVLGCDIGSIESQLVSDLNSDGGRGLAQRCAQLLHIHRCLRLLFPDNRDLVYAWIKSPNRAFDGDSPLNTMINDGSEDYSRVISYLDDALHH